MRLSSPEDGDDPSALRKRAEALRRGLRELERLDWPRWLREADAVTRQIGELLRQAAEAEARRR